MRLELITIVALIFCAGFSSSAQTAPITRSEIEVWSLRLEKNFKEKGGAAFSAQVDIAPSIRRLIEVSPGSNTLKAAMLRSVEKTGAKLAASMDAATSYKYLQAITTNGEAQAIFRLMVGEAALYHYIYLERSSDGALRGYDLFVANVGERISENIHRSYMASVANVDRAALNRLSTKDRDFALSMPQFLQLPTLAALQAWPEIMKIYSGLPASVKTNRSFLLTAIRAASNVDPSTHLRLLELYEKTYPKDLTLSLVLTDGYMARKDYGKALVSIEQGNKAIGGDAFLRYMAAKAHLGLNDYASANREAKGALKDDPGLLIAYGVIEKIALRNRDFSELARMLDVLKTKSGASIRDRVEADKEYAPFLASDVGKVWLKQNPKTRGQPEVKSSKPPSSK